MPAITEPAESLETVRAELEGIDRTIVLLLAERVHAARRAIRLRRRQGADVTDHGQEARVVRRALAWAESAGIPPDLVVRLYSDLIAEGKRTAVSETPASVVTVFLELPGTGDELGGAGPMGVHPERRPVGSSPIVAGHR